jgi:hypothetical protein
MWLSELSSHKACPSFLDIEYQQSDTINSKAHPPSMRIRQKHGSYRFSFVSGFYEFILYLTAEKSTNNSRKLTNNSRIILEHQLTLTYAMLTCNDTEGTSRIARRRRTPATPTYIGKH